MKSNYCFLLMFVFTSQFITCQINSDNIVKKELICKVAAEKIFINKSNQSKLKTQQFVSEFSITFFTIINDTFNIINPLEKSIVKISKDGCIVYHNPLPKTIGKFDFCSIDSNYNYYTCTYAEKIRIFDKEGNVLFVDSISSIKFKINNNNVVYQGKRTYFRDKNKIIKPHSIKHLDASFNSDYYLNKDNLIIITSAGFSSDKLTFLKYDLTGKLVDSKQMQIEQSIYDILILNYDENKKDYLVFVGTIDDKDFPQLLTIDDEGKILSRASLQKGKKDWGTIVSDMELHYLTPDGLVYHYNKNENVLYCLEMHRNYLYIYRYKI
jgi:hypothetical protein